MKRKRNYQEVHEEKIQRLSSRGGDQLILKWQNWVTQPWSWWIFLDYAGLSMRECRQLMADAGLDEKKIIQTDYLSSVIDPSVTRYWTEKTNIFPSPPFVANHRNISLPVRKVLVDWLQSIGYELSIPQRVIQLATLICDSIVFLDTVPSVGDQTEFTQFNNTPCYGEPTENSEPATKRQRLPHARTHKTNGDETKNLLHNVPIDRKSYQSLGAAALCISVKQIDTLKLNPRLCIRMNICGGAYTVEQIVYMERQILHTLKWSLPNEYDTLYDQLVTSWSEFGTWFNRYDKLSEERKISGAQNMFCENIIGFHSSALFLKEMLDFSDTIFLDGKYALSSPIILAAHTWLVHSKAFRKEPYLPIIFKIIFPNFTIIFYPGLLDYLTKLKISTPHRKLLDDDTIALQNYDR